MQVLQPLTTQSKMKPPLRECGNTLICEEWRARIYKRHLLISKYLEKQHVKHVKQSGYVAANRWLLEQEQLLKLGKTGLFCDCDYQQIKDYSEAKSKKTEKQIYEISAVIGLDTELNKIRMTEYIRDQVQAAGLEFPLPESGYSNDERIAALARVCDAGWWRGNLNKIAVTQFEGYARQAGVVSLSASMYCSTLTLNRRQEQKRRNRRLLESLEAVNSQGLVYTLAELADLSVSNPINRRNELMTRIAGFEEYAKNRTSNGIPYCALFLTITCPSKYHAKSIRKKKDGSMYAIPNKKFEGYDPKQANNYLCKTWANIRSEWEKREVKPFGFRMAEPHHDGTPHWHMVLFIPENRVIETSYVFNNHALREDGIEAGADEYRSKIVFIDPSKGSAAGYCAKYISKNIDGYGVETDSYGSDAVQSALRIEAWASAWGIRQFQQIGGASVTVWREARRIKEGSIECNLTPEALPILAAADSGDWETYTELMGGVICKRSERPIRPMMITKKEQNKYGEYKKILEGLVAFGSPIVTRGEIWKIQPVGTAKYCEDSWHSSLQSFYAPQQAA